jgi:hypothetical protein
VQEKRQDKAENERAGKDKEPESSDLEILS